MIDFLTVKIFFKNFAGIKKSVSLQRSQGLSLAVDSADSTIQVAGLTLCYSALKTKRKFSPSFTHISFMF